jgi:hypothetical protein
LLGATVSFLNRVYGFLSAVGPAVYSVTSCVVVEVAEQATELAQSESVAMEQIWPSMPACRHQTTYVH